MKMHRAVEGFAIMHLAVENPEAARRGIQAWRKNIVTSCWMESNFKQMGPKKESWLQTWEFRKEEREERFIKR